MIGLGIVLLVQAATGSYGLAGAVSAVYVVADAGFAILQGRLLDRLGQSRVLSRSCWSSRARCRAADRRRCSRTGRLGSTYAPGGGRRRRAARRSGTCVRARWTHVCAAGPPTCRPRSRSRRSSTRSSSSSARSWSPCSPRRSHPAAGLGTAVVAGLAGTCRPGRAARAPSRPRTRTDRGRRPAARCPGGRCSARRRARSSLGSPVRRRRGRHRRVRRRAGHQGVRRAAARAVGARQPAGRASSPAPSPGRPRPDRAGPAGRARHGAAMAPLPLIDSLPVMALALLARRVRDRADPDRLHLPGRADRAAVPADRGHGDPPHRHRGRGRAGCRARRRGGRPLRRLGGYWCLGRRRPPGRAGRHWPLPRTTSPATAPAP